LPCEENNPELARIPSHLYHFSRSFDANVSRIQGKPENTEGAQMEE
jgi:hypothetical protein